MKLWWNLYIVICIVLISGCGGSRYVEKGKLKETIETEQLKEEYIEAIGIGTPAKDAENETQKRATSRNAAIVEAQFQLVSLIKGVRIKGGVTVEKAMETDSKIQSIVDDTIKGAEIVKTEWLADGGCVVTMRIDKKKLAKKLGVEFEK
jgi:hypothetical protein